MARNLADMLRRKTGLQVVERYYEEGLRLSRKSKREKPRNDRWLLQEAEVQGISIEFLRSAMILVDSERGYAPDEFSELCQRVRVSQYPMTRTTSWRHGSGLRHRPAGAG